MREALVIALVAILVAASAVFSAASGQQPEGGVIYTQSHNAIAGGGGKSTNEATVEVTGTVIVEGTVGQALAGGLATGGQFSVHAGFWFADQLQPTAAPASISGRVTGLEGHGTAARRVRIVLTDLATNEVRFARINLAGFYQFDELEVEHLYLLRAEGPSIAFEPDSITINLLDNITGVDFSATSPHSLKQEEK